ncbi:MAG TPA: response regulator transcription factor [Candidatus Acidoferrales bacterium]|nr:response regulator transcription factor [Candidatus Acidoferrales bacterium]
MPKILIVDDHDVVRQGVRSILQRLRPDWEICGEATNGREATEAAEKFEPDILVLDITMPVMNGLEASRAIMKRGLHSRVLIFTMHEYDRLVDDVKRSGAQGYVQKSQAGRDLIRAIEALLAGGTFFGNPAEATLKESKKPSNGVSEFRALCWA